MQNLLSVIVHGVVDSSSELANNVKGLLGFVMAVVFPLIDKLTPIIQFIGALGGLFLLYFAIRHKIIQFKIDKQKYKNMKNGNNSGY